MDYTKRWWRRKFVAEAPLPLPPLSPSWAATRSVAGASLAETVSKRPPRAFQAEGDTLRRNHPPQLPGPDGIVRGARSKRLSPRTIHVIIAAAATTRPVF